MGQTGSQPVPAAPPRTRRAHTLPHEPLRHAPKVLPKLTASPCLRSTDNGAILHSGGTISGRRVSQHAPHAQHAQDLRTPHGHVHSSGYRSRSAGGASEEFRSRERDPLHRSYTNLDISHHDGVNKRFGSEPDLRIEEEQPKPRCNNNNKHFRKKYRAPPPPTHAHQEHSSPDSSESHARPEPQRKLRLFKTRNETKKLIGHSQSKIPTYKNTYTDFKQLDDDPSFDRRYRSPCKDKEQHCRYPDNNDMVQSTASLKREERIMQENKKSRIDRVSGCRAKTSKTNEPSEAWKTPLLNRNFRYSERFTREGNDQPSLRRERTFDNSLITSEKENKSPKATHESRLKTEHIKESRLSPLAASSKPLRKSLPSLLTKNSEEKDEFQAELKKATSRIRSELGTKLNSISNSKTSQIEKSNIQKPNPTKIATQNKVNESSLKPSNAVNKPESKVAVGLSRRPLTRLNDTKPTSAPQVSADYKCKFNSKESGRSMPDRGQASGKESTPEHSPTRKVERAVNTVTQDKTKPVPSKQFYFGMIESKQTEPKDNLKDFPGLGAPIIEEITNFHLIEKKLLGYHDDEDEFDKFNAKLKEDCKVKNVSSESAVSSWSGSPRVSPRLRPTLPKKQPPAPRFSPAAAWRQLVTLEHAQEHETTPLAVETKMSGDISAESSPRSDQSADQSADKSGDSGISGDHAHSDQRIDSPNRHHGVEPLAWTPQQDLGDSSSDSAAAPAHRAAAVATYAPGAQPFSLSLPRDNERGKQLQQGFNSLQKLKKSVSGAFGAALGARRFDIEHEPMLKEPEQNWFLTKSAPNSLSNPLLFQPPSRAKVLGEEDIKEESAPPSEKEETLPWHTSSASYLSWGGHVMYLPPAHNDQPLSMLANVDRPVRSKSSGCLEAAARAARAALAAEMRERSASPTPLRALPARAHHDTRSSSKSKRFTFQSTVRQLERRRLAEKLSREADLKEQQRRTELEAMRRVEEEFQRKRAREKANIRQQLRLVTSGVASMPATNQHTKTRDSPDGSCRESPAPERPRDVTRTSNASSEVSGRSKSTTPLRSVEVSGWRAAGARVYRDWPATAAAATQHPPACATITPVESPPFSGSPRSDNYRLEFARGRSPRSPRTPRAPRLLSAPRSPSTSGSELSMRQPIKISRETTREEKGETEEPAIVPTLRPSGPGRASIAIR